MPSLTARDGLTPGSDDVDLETVMPLYSQSSGGCFEPIGAALHARRSIEAA
jgi:hypothetical protein